MGTEGGMSEPEREPEESEGNGPAVLPEREAIWILSQASEPENEDDEELADPRNT
jgi:hypothetical protein